MSHTARRSRITLILLVGPLLASCATDGFKIDDSDLPAHRDQAYIFKLQWGSSGTADGQFLLPTGLAVDTQGRVFVADTDGNRVQRFSSTGAFQLKFGTLGAAAGEFNSPRGLAVEPTGTLLVADENNQRIQRFDLDGTFIESLGVAGTGPGQLNFPRSVSVDSGGRIFVIDSRRQVQVFSQTFSFLFAFGDPGTGPGEFQVPAAVHVDTDLTIYVSDTTLRSVQRFDTFGRFLLTFVGSGTLGLPDFLGGNPRTGILVSESSADHVSRFNSNGALIETVGTSGTGTGQLRNPAGVAASAAGEIYVAVQSPPRVVKFVFDEGVP